VSLLNLESKPSVEGKNKANGSNSCKEVPTDVVDKEHSGKEQSGNHRENVEEYPEKPIESADVLVE
jgi:hypothetical protein